jgi:hypothetical protein
VEQSRARPHFFWYNFFRAYKPGAPAKKGLGMALTVTIIVVLALLLFKLWRWLWHITTFLALALFLYLGWPWLSQMRWDDTVMAWLQQTRLPQASAAIPPRVQRYAPPQRTQEPDDYFKELSRTRYPRAYPKPALCAENWKGHDIYFWRGRRWYLVHNEAPYRYLCAPDGRLEWCWPKPPNASAVPCRTDRGDGWCWGSGVGYRNDS